MISYTEKFDKTPYDNHKENSEKKLEVTVAKHLQFLCLTRRILPDGFCSNQRTGKDVEELNHILSNLDEVARKEFDSLPKHILEMLDDLIYARV